MRRGWWWLLFAGLSLARADVLTDRTGVVVRPGEAQFSGSCATGQIGMQGNAGKTYRCVSGRWEREDLPACATTDLAGTVCTKRSVCLNRTDGSILVCNASNLWQLIAGGSGGTPGIGEYNYSQAFSGETSVTLNHNLGTPNVLVACYDTSEIQVLPNSVTIGSSDPYQVVVTFTQAQTGRCVVNGSGNGTPGSGAGGLTDLREDGAARVNDADYIDFLLGFDVNSVGQVSLDYVEKPIDLTSGETIGTLPISKGGTGSTTFTTNTCLRYNGTQIVSAAADCNSGGGAGCVDVDVDCSADNAENVTCVSCITLTDETTGQLGVGQGGTGVIVSADDTVLIGSGTAWVPKNLPSCSNATTSKLLYDTGTNAFSCGTDQSSGSGGTPGGVSSSVQYNNSGAFGGDSLFTYNATTQRVQSTNIQATSLFQGDSANKLVRFDLDLDSTTDLWLRQSGTPARSDYVLPSTGYLAWATTYPGTYQSALFWTASGGSATSFNIDFNGSGGATSTDFCIRETGIDANCDGVIDLNSIGVDDVVLVGATANNGFSQTALPASCTTAVGYNSTTNAFFCATDTSTDWVKGLDYGMDGTAVQMEVDGTTVDIDPDADGTLEARVNADGSIETFGSADESGGITSDGKLLFTADYNNNGTGEGIDLDPDGDGTYEWAVAAAGTLTMAAGALIPGVCSGVTPAATITVNDCNVVVFTSTNAAIKTINTCNAANLGRQLTLLCNISSQVLEATGNLKLAGGLNFGCDADDTWTAICDGTNWREIARSAN